MATKTESLKETLTSNYETQLRIYLTENQINIPEEAFYQLLNYVDLLVAKNEEINLISRKDVENVIEKHIFHSLLLLKYMPPKVTTFLDFGSGGGLPGIPLAIARPDLKGVLVDSIQKKAKALNEFVSKLMLNNVTVECSRCESEEFTSKYPNTFDLIVSRATVKLPVFIRYSVPIMKNKAYVMALKGGDIEAEFQIANLKWKPYIKRSSIIELAYKPNNKKNENEKKLVLFELYRL
jgi:16S rRNA (guanine527-N7)-methyltransferase